MGDDISALPWPKNQVNHLGPFIRSMKLSATGPTKVWPQPSGFFAHAH